MKWKDKITLLVLALFIGGFSLWGTLAPDQAQSQAERRPLAQRPQLTLESVSSGKFMSQWEEYALDQFPLRDGFRGLKAWIALDLLGQKDVNDIYRVGESVSKLEYPLDLESVDYAASRFRFIYERYLEESQSKIYLAIIPDKNYFLAPEGGYPALDYQELVQSLTSQMEYAQYLDIFPLLEGQDYFNTDPHWRQEKILDIAQYLNKAMGAHWEGDFQENRAEGVYRGAYWGQLGLPLAAEDICWMTSEVLDGCRVYDYETQAWQEVVYALEQLEGADPYQLYLYGSKSLLTIENPAGDPDKELIIFRDSFGSSLVPLMVEGYSKITLVDIRYISPMILDRFLEFHGQDILFLYSATVLNNSVTLK